MEKIKIVDVVDEVKTSFLDYAMSVIVARALPDVRDGLKPVHRRIIYAMYDLKIMPKSAFKKSARIVGEVIGKYHPHGDTSVYDAMVRMAQFFAYRIPLIDGQGNFGSMDGDSPAAMRYTEARLAKISTLFVKDIDKETVNFVKNYDESELEPQVLPCYFPNLIVNGSYGIAVGMATNILPHNLGEVIECLIKLADNNELSLEEILTIIKGPDLPTGGLISSENLYEVYKNGHGPIKIRAKVEIKHLDPKKRQSVIIVKEIPYQVNKAKLITKIVELINQKSITEIKEIRDESNQKGVRIVIVLKKDVDYRFVLNNLYKFTNLQINNTLNFVVLKENIPYRMSLKEILLSFIEHYLKLILKRSIFELKQKERKLHINKGLLIAIDNINLIIKIIKSSKDNKVALFRFNQELNLSAIQGKAILEMQLQRLNRLQQDKLKLEILNCEQRIIYLKELIASKPKQINVFKEEQNQIKENFKIKRLSKIVDRNFEINEEQLIKKEHLIIIFSENSYIKALKTNVINVQNRAGRGRNVIDKNFLIKLSTTAFSLQDCLLFSSLGKVYKLKAYQIPSYLSNYSKGIPINNLIKELKENEKIQKIITLDYKANFAFKYIYLVSAKGKIKKTRLSAFKKINRSGKKAIVLDKNDYLVDSFITKEKKSEEITNQEYKNSVGVVTKKGQIIKFFENEVRKTGRVGKGVRAIKLNKNDFVINAFSNFEAQQEKKSAFIALVSENGIGKKINFGTILNKHRYIKGVRSMKLNGKTENLKFCTLIDESNDLLVFTKQGKIIRINYHQIPIHKGRNTSGVKLIKLQKNDKVQYVSVIKKNIDASNKNKPKPGNLNHNQLKLDVD